MITNQPRLLFYIGILSSIGCLWIIFASVDTHKIITDLGRANVIYAIPLLLTFTLYYWTKAIRWKYLLRPIIDTPTKTLIPSMMLGFFANNLLPAHLGEFLRMYLGAKILRLSNSEVLATIILERIFDILAIVILIGVLLNMDINLPDIFVTSGYIATALGAALFLLVILYAFKTQAVINIIDKLMFFLPKLIRKKVNHLMLTGAEGLSAVKQPRLLIIILFTSVLQWIFMGITIHLSLMALNINSPLSASFVVLVLTVFAVIVPAAPGFIGTIQIAFILALNPFGVSDTEAVAASVYYHVLTYTSVIFLGFYLMHRIGYTFKQLQQESTVKSAEPHI